MDYDKTDNVYTKEKKPQNELDEHLKSLDEEYNHTRRTGATHGENRNRCVISSSCHATVLGQISIISGNVFFLSHLEKYLFYHSWSNMCCITTT